MAQAGWTGWWNGSARDLLPSHYATALGNMFRHKGRLIMTQLVLIAAGASFLMVMSSQFVACLDTGQFFGRQRYDTTIGFNDVQSAGPGHYAGGIGARRGQGRRSASSSRPVCSWRAIGQGGRSGHNHSRHPVRQRFFQTTDGGRTLAGTRRMDVPLSSHARPPRRTISRPATR